MKTIFFVMLVMLMDDSETEASKNGIVILDEKASTQKLALALAPAFFLSMPTIHYTLMSIMD